MVNIIMKAKLIAIVVALVATVTGTAAPNGYKHNRVNVDSTITVRINKNHFNSAITISNHHSSWDGCYTYEQYDHRRPRYVTIATRVIAYDQHGRPYIRTVYRRVLTH